MEKQENPFFSLQTAEARLATLRELAPGLAIDRESLYVNNHIHTIYSFSPYSPVEALYFAQQAGLSTAGIMDHDSVAGAEEFIQGAEILGMGATVGVELRVSMRGTPYADRRLNNPDQEGCAYVAMHGIPHQSLSMVEGFLAPIRVSRFQRVQRMLDRLNDMLAACGLYRMQLESILPLTEWEHGGTITERHICFALAIRLIGQFGTGQSLLDALGDKLRIPVPAKIAQLLCLPDAENPFVFYDLLGLLKSELVPKFYVPATEECPSLADYLDITHQAGAIAAYPYLGDVGDSVTGDKRTQAFEDAFLDELFADLSSAGFDAITYMPTRNTAEQLQRVQALCDAHGFFQISGEDINTPRQSFICPQLLQPEYAHLRTATWALIGHEKAATNNLEDGMFSEKTKAALPSLQERIAHFAAIGRERQT